MHKTIFLFLAVMTGMVFVSVAQAQNLVKKTAGAVSRAVEKQIPNQIQSSVSRQLMEVILSKRREILSQPAQYSLDFKLQHDAQGNSVYIASNGVSLVSQSEVAAYVHAAKKRYHSVVVGDGRVAGFFPVPEVFVRTIWDADQCLEALKRGYKVEITDGAISHIILKNDVAVNNLGTAVSYEEALKSGIAPEVQDGRLVAFYPVPGVRLRFFSHAQDYIKAHKQGFETRIQDGKLTGFSTGKDMWFYHLKDAQAYAQSLRENALQRITDGLLEVKGEKSIFFRFDPKYNAYFWVDPAMLKDETSPTFFSPHF